MDANHATMIDRHTVTHPNTQNVLNAEVIHAVMGCINVAAVRSIKMVYRVDANGTTMIYRLHTMRICTMNGQTVHSHAAPTRSGANCCTRSTCIRRGSPYAGWACLGQSSPLRTWEQNHVINGVKLTPQHIVWHRNTLYGTATHCMAPQHNACYRNTFYGTATQCMLLQHKASYCDMMHFTGTMHYVGIFCFMKTFCLMNIRPQDLLSHEPTLWFNHQLFGLGAPSF